MKRIPLTRGLHALVDDEDYPRVARFSWYAHKPHNVTYAQAADGRQTLRMHRVVLGVTGGEIVDHINGNGLDNRRKNLRVTTASQNQANMRSIHPNKTSRFKGVCRKGRRWRAQLQANGKKINLGYYASEVEAAVAYNAGATKHFGKFAALNDVPDGVVPQRIYKSYPQGENHRDAKLTREQALAILHSKAPTTELMRTYGIDRSTINNLRSRKTWKGLEEREK